MRISQTPSSQNLSRLSRVNAGLSQFLSARSSRAAAASFADPGTGSAAGFTADSRPSFSSSGLLAQSLAPLLTSVTTATESVTAGRLKLRKVRGELEKIRDIADRSRRVPGFDRDEGQRLIDEAIAKINQFGGDPLAGATASRTAGQAELTLRGAANGQISADDNWLITGSLGQAEIFLQRGQSLDAVAFNINRLSSRTGVTAAIEDGNLVFRSIDAGSQATISVQSLGGVTDISGVDPDQLVDFSVNAIQPGSTDTLAGSVIAAEGASLLYDGNAAGQIFDGAQFTISGSEGTAVVGFSPDASLSDLAGLINQRTAETGVTAAVENGNLLFQSLETGSEAAISVSLDYNELEVNGVNATQVDSVEVLSLQPGASHTLSGNVDVAALQAQQTYAGQDGRVVRTARFLLDGDLGSAAISITRGESLNDVADRVNQKTLETGVTARVESDNLIFESVGYGTQSGFTITVTDLIDVEGINPLQVEAVRVDSIAGNANETLSGRVDHTAEQAELKYDGDNGLVRKDATFTVTGNQGSIQVTVAAGESLADVAAEINQQSSSTGVSARLDNGDLFFNSVSYGTQAQVYVEVDSGEFNVSGGTGFGDGRIDYGKDAEAKINGIDYIGDGNRFSLSEGFGEFTVDFAAGFEGDFDKISVVSASSASINISPLNAQQVADFQVNSIDPGDSQTIVGEVRDEAEQATLKYDGDGGSLVKANATVSLTGNLGTTQFSVTGGESLADVAARVNLQTANTGVAATVDGDDLFLTSVGYGSAAQVLVTVDSGEFNVSGGSDHAGGEIDYGKDAKVKIDGQEYFADGNRLVYSQGSGNFTIDFAAGFKGHFDAIQVASTIGADNLTDGEHAQASGVNATQFARFEINQAVADSVQTVSGEVVHTGERAELKYDGGAGGIVKDNATFILTGDEGLISVNVSANEALLDVAQRINDRTADTGVIATVENDDLFLRSVEYGDNASVSVEVLLGQFDVTGGTGVLGVTVDVGKNLEAKINGVTYFGDGNELTFSDSSGDFTVEFVAGFQGHFDTVKVGSINDAFQLVGGNGDGSASGRDAQAVINGQSLVGDGNRFVFSDSLGTYRIDVAEGYSGGIDPIEISSTSRNYEISGGNGDGTANGQDREVIVNGQSLAGDGPRYSFQSALGNYELEFVEGFIGDFGEIKITSKPAGQLDLAGGNGDGTASGTDAVTRAVSDNFDAPAISLQVFDQLRLVGSFTLGLDVKTLGGRSGRVEQLASNGSKSGLGENAVDAIQIAEQAIAYVSSLEQLLQRSADRVVSTAAAEQGGVGSGLEPALAFRNSVLSSGNSLFNATALRGPQVLSLLQRS